MLAVGAGVLVLTGLVLALTRWPAINVVETGKTPEYPDLIPQVYQANPERVFDAAMHAVNQLPRWSLIAYDPATGEIRAEARTRMFRFVDDVVVRVGEGKGGTIVSIRSASRVGRGDFGQNARNIRALYEELDRQLHVADHR